ncbi:MAG: cob(I)yrinic acid a,c-diamide adenosyltransferase [Bacteroidales bacterium]|nr:cob(I)yrinic acid a,c-diamide adenosyltransferase [Bacteroidales bacterium]MCF8334575.1 cob(I)yrinic acid a,c-diamide adenosyltransferase [Bacteroidales bacterium]
MESEFKIYTKLGDKGETSLLGGSKVPKYHERIEAYGTLDELNSFIGLVRDHIDIETIITLIKRIQDRIFTIEARLAAETRQAEEYLPDLTESDITDLEKAIDSMEQELPPIKNFVLPGGHPAVSYSHVARTICRRAERTVIRLAESASLDPLIVQYLNRLSDYFFVLSRYLTKYFNVEETIWKSKF